MTDVIHGYGHGYGHGNGAGRMVSPTRSGGPVRRRVTTPCTHPRPDTWRECAEVWLGHPRAAFRVDDNPDRYSPLTRRKTATERPGR